jgi:hypothetical protein
MDAVTPVEFLPELPSPPHGPRCIPDATTKAASLLDRQDCRRGCDHCSLGFECTYEFCRPVAAIRLEDSDGVRQGGLIPINTD